MPVKLVVGDVTTTADHLVIQVSGRDEEGKPIPEYQFDFRYSPEPTDGLTVEQWDALRTAEAVAEARRRIDLIESGASRGADLVGKGEDEVLKVATAAREAADAKALKKAEDAAKKANAEVEAAKKANAEVEAAKAAVEAAKAAAADAPAVKD